MFSITSTFYSVAVWNSFHKAHSQFTQASRPAPGSLREALGGQALGREQREPGAGGSGWPPGLDTEHLLEQANNAHPETLRSSYRFEVLQSC